MNKQNYGSREACQRLVDARIVLETDFCWYSSVISDQWLLKCSKWKNGKKIPAPSMAEVWRELPKYSRSVCQVSE